MSHVAVLVVDRSTPSPTWAWLRGLDDGLVCQLAQTERCFFVLRLSVCTPTWTVPTTIIPTLHAHTAPLWPHHTPMLLPQPHSLTSVHPHRQAFLWFSCWTTTKSTFPSEKSRKGQRAPVGLILTRSYKSVDSHNPSTIINIRLRWPVGIKVTLLETVVVSAAAFNPKSTFYPARLEPEFWSCMPSLENQKGPSKTPTLKSWGRFGPKSEFWFKLLGPVQVSGLFPEGRTWNILDCPSTMNPALVSLWASRDWFNHVTFLPPGGGVHFLQTETDGCAPRGGRLPDGRRRQRRCVVKRKEFSLKKFQLPYIICRVLSSILLVSVCLGWLIWSPSPQVYQITSMMMMTTMVFRTTLTWR